MIDSVAVVIPARDEERLLGGCLRALRRALDQVRLPYLALVVLDACRDGSAAVVAREPGVVAVKARYGNVGQARRAGFEAALRILQGRGLRRPWLATTDADSQVPADWLAVQLRLAREGAEVVLGTVVVRDWRGRDPELRPRLQAAYRAIEGHPHVHGANLGLCAAAYLRNGGFPPRAVAEDAALVGSLERNARLVRTATIPVVTSARRDPRARGGFGDYLNDLETLSSESAGQGGRGRAGDADSSD